ncbi:MAG TPA: peptidylprolyl isomerase [Candidatus Nanoarchaeia archaeon]|nr:peptidylprolyl isomerase [Candidatus Nanoarchaeia archaeon]
MIKKGDFIQLDYTGSLTETQEVFDTTEEKVAKEKKLYNPKVQYKPATIIVGESQVVPGLDKNLDGKNIGEHTFALKAEEAFGLKNPKLLKLIPLKSFTSQRIQPFVGLDVNIDNQMGVVRSVNSGRIIVDFNHPLSSKDITYHVKVHKILTDPKEKIEAWFHITGLTHGDIKIEGKKALVEIKQELPEPLLHHFQEQITRYTGTETVLNTVGKTKPSSDKKEETKPVAVKKS